jgi:hypothetical protein
MKTTPLFLLALIMALVSGVSAANFTPEIAGEDVHYNITTHMDTGATTPFDIWLLATVVGVLLFGLAFAPPSSNPGILVGQASASVVGWIFLGFAALTSFAVERITSSGTVATPDSGIVLLENHVIYHFDVIGYLLAFALLITIVNTIRLLAWHQALRLEREKPPTQRYY